MSGNAYRLRDRAALLAALLVPFLLALALVPVRTDLSGGASRSCPCAHVGSDQP